MKLHVSTTARTRTGAVRLLVVWAAAFVTSSVANIAVGAAVRAILNLPSDFAQVAPPDIILATFVGVATAVIVFAIVARVAEDPLWTYMFVVAPIGLIVSWLFDLALYVSRAFPGTTGRSVLSLMFLHVIAGVITVLLLRAQGLRKALAGPMGSLGNGHIAPEPREKVAAAAPLYPELRV